MAFCCFLFSCYIFAQANILVGVVSKLQSGMVTLEVLMEKHRCLRMRVEDSIREAQEKNISPEDVIWELRSKLKCWTIRYADWMNVKELLVALNKSDASFTFEGDNEIKWIYLPDAEGEKQKHEIIGEQSICSCCSTCDYSLYLNSENSCPKCHPTSDDQSDEYTSTSGFNENVPLNQEPEQFEHSEDIIDDPHQYTDYYRQCSEADVIEEEEEVQVQAQVHNKYSDSFEEDDEHVVAVNMQAPLTLFNPLNDVIESDLPTFQIPTPIGKPSTPAHGPIRPSLELPPRSKYARLDHKGHWTDRNFPCSLFLPNMKGKNNVRRIIKEMFYDSEDDHRFMENPQTGTIHINLQCFDQARVAATYLKKYFKIIVRYTAKEGHSRMEDPSGPTSIFVPVVDLSFELTLREFHYLSFMMDKNKDTMYFNFFNHAETKRAMHKLRQIFAEETRAGKLSYEVSYVIPKHRLLDMPVFSVMVPDFDLSTNDFFAFIQEKTGRGEDIVKVGMKKTTKGAVFRANTFTEKTAEEFIEILNSGFESGDRLRVTRAFFGVFYQ
eukprot:TRINITY_DN4584_c0_g1_i3.p1 TRINITY_DN4584_c0_g1~~TRINITY_DN4584_c0_g1_i3.p1  ORF type:complete len:551 (+),score=158.43 TRINITY_DN4584_c0_g1_i3:111-1763(+)